MDSLFGDGPDADVPPDNVVEVDLSQDVVAIAPRGDVVLEVHSDQGDDERVFFRVSRDTLRASSKYFDRLLDPTKFQEGVKVQQRLEQLDINGEKTFTPIDQLPQVKIVGIGEASNIKSIKPLMSDFLNLLHGNRVFGARSSPPLINLANLAIVADRFDACSSLLSKLRGQGALREQAQQRDKEKTKSTVEQLRQRVFIGLTLGHEQWTRMYLGELIISGEYISDKNAGASAAAPWWDLPHGIEQEIPFRRKAILSTIQSLQDYVLERFTSSTQQCRLGYDSSPQCDSFQAGEFVKFLIRADGIQQLKNCTRHKGDIRKLVEKLRRFPEYQVNTFHSHCGPKKLFNTGLLFISRHMHTAFIGFSPGCCPNHKLWSSEKKAGAWSGPPGLPPSDFAMENDGSCMYRGMHEPVRSFWLANDKDWTFLKQRMLYRDFEAA